MIDVSSIFSDAWNKGTVVSGQRGRGTGLGSMENTRQKPIDTRADANPDSPAMAGIQGPFGKEIHMHGTQVELAVAGETTPEMEKLAQSVEQYLFLVVLKIYLN